MSDRPGPKTDPITENERTAEEWAAELARLTYRQALQVARERATREYLVALMRRFEGNVTHAAVHAGLVRESMHRLLRRHGLRSEDFKPGRDQP